MNDLLDVGILLGSTTLAEVDDYAPWVKIPSELMAREKPKSAPIPKPMAKAELRPPQLERYDETDQSLRRAIEYLNDYPSVGIMRFNIDLQSLQLTDTDRILRQLTDEGFVEVSPLGVVNATPRLPKLTKKVTLGDLISPKT